MRQHPALVAALCMHVGPCVQESEMDPEIVLCSADIVKLWNIILRILFHMLNGLMCPETDIGYLWNYSLAPSG